MDDEKKFEHKGRMIRAEIETSATPLQVWEAWADPEKITQWFVDRASGEAKPGGTMTWFFDRFGFEFPFKVLDAVPGSLIVLKWEPPQGPAGIHEVRIERKGGMTVMRLIESGFREDAQWDEEYEGTVSGWQMALAVLKYYLENYFGQRKTTLLVIRPASFAYEQLLPYFLDPSKLWRWLVKSGSIGKAGEKVQLDLGDSGKLTGRVLTITKREVALSWEEIGGTLELKGFSMGPQRIVGLRCFTWKLAPTETKQLEIQLGAAVERLAALLPAAASASSASSETQFGSKK
jgi:uncharacterized protein YndB with AHSA1/START domain